MRIAITGIRDVSPGDLPVIEDGMMEVLSERPEGLFFGGARGTDTVALAGACTALAGRRPPALVVVVPKRLSDQPLAAQEWARECADEIVELRAPRLDPAAYRRRNEALVARADGLVAFWDGSPGGTEMTIGIAEAAGKPVHIVYLGSPGRSSLGNAAPFRPSAAFRDPWPHWRFDPTPAVGMPVFTLGAYMSAIQGLDRLSQFVRASKAGTVAASETRYWAGVVADVVQVHPELAAADAIMAVPRRVPGAPNDLAPLVARVAAETGKRDAAEALSRIAVPTEGTLRARRERFPADEHARTMAVEADHPAVRSLEPGSKVILLDNVLTYGGTLEGARRAVARDLPSVDIVGVTLLVSEDYGVPQGASAG